MAMFTRRTARYWSRFWKGSWMLELLLGQGVIEKVKIYEERMDVLPPLMCALRELVEGAGMTGCLDGTEHDIVTDLCLVLFVEGLKEMLCVKRHGKTVEIEKLHTPVPVAAWVGYRASGSSTRTQYRKSAYRLEARNTVQHFPAVDIIVGQEEYASDAGTPDHAIKVSGRCTYASG